MILTVTRGGLQQDTVFRRRTDFDVDATVPFDVTTDLVFIGYGSTDADFNEFGNLDLRDKIVVRLDGLPGQTSPGGMLFKKARDARQAQTARMMQAAEQGDADAAAGDDPGRRLTNTLRNRGAAGCITVALPTAESAASLPPPSDAAWSVNAPFRNLPLPALKMFEGDRPPVKRQRLRLPGRLLVAADGRPELFRDAGDPFMITITPEAAETLFAHTGQTLDGLRRRIDSTGRPASFPLAGARIRIRNDVRTEIVNGKNLVGVVQGSDPVLQHEVIVVGAHLDHIGAFNNVIFNGADDNASGAAAVLELARAFSAESGRPRRTIVFGLWCGEEDGFLGARYFVSHPYAPLAQVVAVVNPDMIGRLSPPGDSRARKLAVHTSSQTPLLKQIVAESCRLAGLEADYVDETFEGLSRSDARSLGSDHAAFADRDIGFIYLETGFHDDYHSFLDHADKINYDGMEAVTRVAFLAVQKIAALDVRPTFDKSIARQKAAHGLRVLRSEEMESDRGAPKALASTESVARPTSATTAGSPGTGKRIFRLTFDLVGKTDDSRFEGTITVSSGGRTLLSSDTIVMRGFRDERAYVRGLDVAGCDLPGWAFDGRSAAR